MTLPAGRGTNRPQRGPPPPTIVVLGAADRLGKPAPGADLDMMCGQVGAPGAGRGVRLGRRGEWDGAMAGVPGPLMPGGVIAQADPGPAGQVRRGPYTETRWCPTSGGVPRPVVSRMRLDTGQVLARELAGFKRNLRPSSFYSGTAYDR